MSKQSRQYEPRMTSEDLRIYKIAVNQERFAFLKKLADYKAITIYAIVALVAWGHGKTAVELSKVWIDAFKPDGFLALICAFVFGGLVVALIFAGFRIRHFNKKVIPELRQQNRELEQQLSGRE